MLLLQVTVVRSELEKLKKEHEKLKSELSKVSFTYSRLSADFHPGDSSRSDCQRNAWPISYP